jgi:hypothetical protein
VSLKRRRRILSNLHGYQPEKISYNSVAVKAWRHIKVVCTFFISDVDVGFCIFVVGQYRKCTCFCTVNYVMYMYIYMDILYIMRNGVDIYL